VISDNRLINEVGLLPIEHTGPEGRGERHARTESRCSGLRLVEHGTRLGYCPAQDHPPQTATLSSCQPSYVFIFFYISLLIFRYFPPLLHLTLLQFKTRNHNEVEGDNA